MDAANHFPNMRPNYNFYENQTSKHYLLSCMCLSKYNKYDLSLKCKYHDKNREFTRKNTEQESWAIKNKATEKMLSVFLVNSRVLTFSKKLLISIKMKFPFSVMKVMTNVWRQLSLISCKQDQVAEFLGLEIIYPFVKQFQL